MRRTNALGRVLARAHGSALCRLQGRTRIETSQRIGNDNNAGVYALVRERKVAKWIASLSIV
jgi:hypothetical protein